MTETYASIWLDELDIRHQEIEKLITLAKAHYLTDESIFNAVCRSATVLLYAHFEGSLRTAISSFAGDLSLNGGYAALNERIKALFLCGLLEIEVTSDNVSKSRDRQQKLDAKLDGASGLRINLDHLWPGSKNATADTYKTVIKRFGIDNIFYTLEESDLETAMFTEGIMALKRRFEVTKQRFAESFATYPYQSMWSIIGQAEAKTRRQKTITEEFITNTIKPRHDIAHGEVLDSVLLLEQIELASIRLRWLSIIFYLAIVERNSPQTARQEI